MEDRLDEWNDLVEKITYINLTDEGDLLFGAYIAMVSLQPILCIFT